MTQDKKNVLAAFEAACQEAAQKREANRELRDALRRDPEAQARLREALIADIKRVHEHPANPFAGFSASRQRYRQLGHYPEILVTDTFGNHQEMLRAAGLHDTRNTTRCRNKAARLHTHQSIADYADREIRRYHGAYQKHEGRKHLEVVIGSDFHSAFVDPFALRCFLDTIKIVGPDVVVLNGDVLDLPQISRHRQMPGHFWLNLQEEIDFTREQILRPVREAAPKASILWVQGNHENRAASYIADTAPQLASLRSLRFGELFGLDELEIGLVARSSYLNPTAKDKQRALQENWHILGDCYVVTHGVSCAKVAAAVQLERYRMSGTSGHVHRPHLIWDNALGTGPLSWLCTGMLASHAVGRDYVSEPSAWTMGFGVASILPGKKLVSQQLVPVYHDWCSFAGHSWMVRPGERAAREKLWEVAA